MKTRFPHLLGILAAGTLLLSGCGSDVHDGVNMKNLVGYGAVIPNTGPYRGVGSELYRGMLTAEYSLNNSGGVESRGVKIVMYDSAGEPEKGLDGVRVLTREFEVPFLGVALPVVVDRAALEYSRYDTMACRLEAASRDTANAAENTIQAYVNAEDEIDVMAATARREGWKSVLTLVVEDRYGEAAAERLANKLTKAGATRVDHLPLRLNPPVATLRETLARSPYDAVCIFAHGPEVGPVLMELATASRFAGAIVGNHAFGGKVVNRLDPAVLERVRFTAPAFHNRPDRPMTARFINEYTRYNRDTPDIFSALGYDQVMLVFSASKNEESLNPETIRRRIIADGVFEGAAGTYRFDATGSARLELSLIPVAGVKKINRETTAP